MRIEGDGWALRPERVDDAGEMARAFAEDPHLAVDWGIDEIPDEELARRWLGEHAAAWEEGEGRHFAVADADTDALLGGVNFHRIEPGHHRAEVGFWLAPWARRRGIGTRAVGAACKWAFEQWDLVRIEMTTLPDNEAALALARKLGFTREGLLRSRNFERGKQVDIVMLAVLAGELAPGFDQNVELARHAYEALDRHDKEAYLALMDEEVEIESLLAAVEGSYHGHEGVRRWWDDFLSVFPDYRLEIEELRACGEATVGRFRGTAHGASAETPVVDPFWHAMRWRAGKCVWWRSCATEAEALEALEQSGLS